MALTTEFNVRHRHLAAGIDDAHPAQFGIGLAHGFQHRMLSGKQFVLVGVDQFAHDLVLLARLVALACQENGVVGGELGGVGTFQPARHELRSSAAGLC